MEKAFSNLKEAYEKCGDDGLFKDEFDFIYPSLSNIPIKKVFIDYCKRLKYIDIIMNIGNKTIFSIGFDKNSDNFKKTIVSISKDNEFIIVDIKDINSFIEKIANSI